MHVCVTTLGPAPKSNFLWTWPSVIHSAAPILKSGSTSTWPTCDFRQQSHKSRLPLNSVVGFGPTTIYSWTIGIEKRGRTTSNSKTYRRPSMDTSTVSKDRFSRQQDLVPAERLAELTVT